MGSAEKYVKLNTTPQGTVDVSLGSVHLKTFGGPKAGVAAQDFANLIIAEIEKAIDEVMAATRTVTVSAGPSTSSSGDVGHRVNYDIPNSYDILKRTRRW